ncbi:hypothetical protein GCM10010911_18180 [Paenibacillus nasutitermitis]|uniref:Uncharacterized protein n=2 Tax=Paenibacillus nasutitermitis TaxID=1652958 RepID=A0A916YUQ9_9BACL|nr:hypothetical protein GCM10010911_18180 [Paenibacillus nasutitermitis]
MKKRLLSVLMIAVLILSLSANASASTESEATTNSFFNSDGIGDVAVNTVPLPSYVILREAHYTYSGKILISYKTANDLNIADYINIALLNDDGSNFNVIFSGVLPPGPSGLRFLPFKDNKRVLMGDYVLECSPNINNCSSTQFIPIEYPSSLTNSPNTFRVWSEVIIAPDNQHISWTTLRADLSSAVLIGSLVRNTDKYVVDNVKIISTVEAFRDDPNNPGFVIPNTLRGGEVKQFVKGGTAISLVGALNRSTTDSIVQDLTSDNLTQITNTPGYDETTIFSPDERLGIVMSTRFSEDTDPAIFGLLPRPHGALNLGPLNGILYTYSVSDVRRFREGNIGPVLININRSKYQPGYQGVPLNTEANWVFASPMSWHPDNKHALWQEIYRGTGTEVKRLQRVTLLEYQPLAPVPVQTTPDNIPYGISDLSVLDSINSNVNVQIKGRHSGYRTYAYQMNPNFTITTQTQYVNYSDDALSYYNGTESLNLNYFGETRYEADLQSTGLRQGEMDLRATFLSSGGFSQTKLLFDTDVDGLPKSHGHATYFGTTLHMEDLLE